MKKIIITLAIISTVILSGATASALSKPSYCGTTPYDKAYQLIYAYPTGSYWKTQIKAYPKFYTTNNAYYTAKYGC